MPGKPKMKKMTENDCREWKFVTVDPFKGTPADQVLDLVMYAESQLSAC